MTNDISRKKVFVVLGMARTGTSAISRSLKVFGVNHGDMLMNGKSEWNPTGCWEDREIVYGVNGKIFSRLDFAPYGMLTIPEEDLSSGNIPDIHASAAAILTSRLQQTDFFGFKDPSTIKVLPFWREVFNTLGLQDYYLIALRNPLAAARSYHKITGCGLELSLLLWCTHMLQAVDGTKSAKRIIVSYDLLMQDPRRQLERMQSVLNPIELNEQEAEYYSSKFLKDKLNRFQSSEEEFTLHNAVKAAALTKEIYDCLLKVANDERTFESPEFMKCWQDIHAAYEKLKPMYAYLDRLLKKRRLLTLQKRDLLKSYLWKVVSPFMFVETRFREWRRKKHFQRRMVF